MSQIPKIICEHPIFTKLIYFKKTKHWHPQTRHYSKLLSPNVLSVRSARLLSGGVSKLKRCARCGAIYNLRSFFKEKLKGTLPYVTYLLTYCEHTPVRDAHGKPFSLWPCSERGSSVCIRYVREVCGQLLCCCMLLSKAAEKVRRRAQPQWQHHTRPTRRNYTCTWHIHYIKLPTNAVRTPHKIQRRVLSHHVHDQGSFVLSKRSGCIGASIGFTRSIMTNSIAKPCTYTTYTHVLTFQAWKKRGKVTKQ